MFSVAAALWQDFPRAARAPSAHTKGAAQAGGNRDHALRVLRKTGCCPARGSGIEVKRMEVASPRDRLAACARGPALMAQLRALTTAELVALQPGPRACDVNDAVVQAGEAMQQAVRRRAGWLYVAPADVPLPVVQSARRVQVALFCFAAGVLRSGHAAGSVQLVPGAKSVLLVLRGGNAQAMPEDFYTLWRVLGHNAVAVRRGAFGAAVRLPLQAAAPTGLVPTAQTLLEDRYSPLYLYLPGRCAGPD